MNNSPSLSSHLLHGFFLPKLTISQYYWHPSDLHFFPVSIIPCARPPTSSLLLLNFLILFESAWTITAFGCSSTNVRFAKWFSYLMFEPLKHLKYTACPTLSFLKLDFSNHYCFSILMSGCICIRVVFRNYALLINMAL